MVYSNSYIMTGSYNNFFRIFDRQTKRDVMLEASKDIAKPKTILKPRKVSIFSIFFSYLSSFEF
jgi:serine/threonine-protein phosphatase 2A regulatory subunit B